MLASTWYDLVIGVDLHYELVPPAMAPVPFPHPFMGLVFDPVGLGVGLGLSNAVGMALGDSFKGPILINSMPATTTGTDAKNCFLVPHFILPPGTAWAPMVRAPKPAVIPGKAPSLELPVPPPGDAVMITGSKTVHALGANLCRLGDVALSCSDPVRLPTSMVLTVPKGLPVLVGGPPAVDWLAAGFAFIRCKWVADRLHKLIDRLKSARVRNLFHKGACFLTGHPVDVATGRVLTDAQDFELPGPLPLRFERNYASSWAHRDSPVGYGWSHSLDQAVWLEEGRVVYRAEDGREIEFDTFDFPKHTMRAGDELFEPLNRLTLRSLGKFRWEIETHAGIVHELEPVPGDRNAQLARLVRKRSRNDHVIELHYDAQARLEWVRDSGGRIIRFDHDERDKLVCIRLPHPTEKGLVPFVRYVYSDEGDLIEAVDALGNGTKYEYAGHLLVRETDRTGLSFYFGYDGVGPDAYCIRTWGDGGIYDHAIDYDKIGHVTWATDSLQATTTYTMNAAGAVIEVLDAMGGETRYEYDDNLRKTAESDPLGNTTRYEYDERGNLAKMVGPDEAVVAVEYDDRNLPMHAVDPCGGKWRWKYDRWGQVTEDINPLGDVTKYEYEGGLLAAAEEPGGVRTSLTYDEAKNVRSVRLPSGAVLHADRDAHGRIVARYDDRGRYQRRHYDAAGRVIMFEEPDGNVWRLSYDAEGNLIETQSHWRRVQFRYGHFHKLVARIEASLEQRFRWDTEGRLVEVTNELGETYRFERDRCGRITAEQGFDGRISKYSRDIAGRVIEVRRPSGAVTRIEYDAAGRVIEKNHTDGTTERYAYRADGALREAVHQGIGVTFERDALGRPIRESVGDRWVASKYDGSSRVEVTSSYGATASVRRNGTGQLEAMAARAGAARWTADFVHDVTGKEVARLLPGRVTLHRSYERAGELEAQRVVRDNQETEALSFAWGPGGRLLSRSDSLRGRESFRYDSRGRLIAAQRDAKDVEYRMPDAAGRIYRDLKGADRRYARGGALEHAAGIRYVYDADGNLVEKIAPKGFRWKYAYYGSGLLKEVKRQDGWTVRYEYDGLGRRVSKTVDGVTTTFVWDGSAMLHEVSGKDDPVTWLFDETGFVPMARLQGSSGSSVVVDQVGAPRALYDGAGQVVWRGRVDTYGASSAEVARVPCPWRFPGQYEDPETGLCYNRFRYYDPATGRYISQDPIGLLGGLDLYGYVADPLLEIDPFGLNGHHTIPVALMKVLHKDGLVSKEMLDDLGRPAKSRPELKDLLRRPRNLHSDVHSALSDFLNSKYERGLSRGFQHEGVWEKYLEHLREGQGLSGKAKLERVLEDFGEFYHNRLPATSVLHSLDDAARREVFDGLKKSFDEDAAKLKNACR